MKRKDILEREPEIGDLIAYNPPYNRGIVTGTIIGFSTGGLPIVQMYAKRTNSIKTGFVIVKSERWP